MSKNDIGLIARAAMFRPAAAAFGQACYVIALYAIYAAFKDIVPERVLNAWGPIALAFAAAGLAIDFYIFTQSRRMSVPLVNWWFVLRRLMVAADCLAIVMLWMFLPYADDVHVLELVIYSMGFVIFQMLSDPEAARTNQFAIVGLIGTLLGYFAISFFSTFHIRDLVFGLFMAMFGGHMIFVAELVRKLIIEAIRRADDSEKTNAELRRAYAEVEAARDAKTRFMQAASHDLQQPLQAAKLFLNALKIPARQSKLKSGLSDSLDSSTTILSGVMDFVRFEGNEQPIRNQAISAVKLLSKIAAQQKPAAAAAGIKIKVEPTKTQLRSDANILERALTNFVVNAIKHSKGSILQLSAVRTQNATVRFTVSDNGVGLAAHDAQHVFDDFYQGKAATESCSGFGIGLATVKRIATLLNGIATVENCKSGGCAFVLEIPEAEVPA